jgi:hypothetical protein
VNSEPRGRFALLLSRFLTTFFLQDSDELLRQVRAAFSPDLRLIQV